MNSAPSLWEYHGAAAAAFERLAERAGSEDARTLRALHAFAKTLQAANRHAAPLAYGLRPGFVIVGAPSAPRAIPRPARIKGFEAAWVVLALGERLPDSVTAAQLAGARGNALRGQLDSVALWLDRIAPELAIELRAPCISIGKDGRVRCAPRRPIEIIV